MGTGFVTKRDLSPDSYYTVFPWFGSSVLIAEVNNRRVDSVPCLRNRHVGSFLTRGLYGPRSGLVVDHLTQGKTRLVRYDGQVDPVSLLLDWSDVRRPTSLGGSCLVEFPDGGRRRVVLRPPGSSREGSTGSVLPISQSIVYESLVMRVHLHFLP